MPTLTENQKCWNENYSWIQRGDEWSEWWGGTQMQWHTALLPRIQMFVPAGRILEIAPGYGRWTQFLANLCEELVVVDLAERCIQACQERFQDKSHIKYHVNDGYSLDSVQDASIDFVFSFDSLVHVEDDVIRSYLIEISNKLTVDGVGFIHHSNCGAYAGYFSTISHIPIGAGVMSRLGLLDARHWRAMSMTADRFERISDSVGLQCISQEIVNWRSRRLIDCMSTFTRKGSKWSRPNQVRRNSSFVREAQQACQLAKLYGRDSFKHTDVQPNSSIS